MSILPLFVCSDCPPVQALPENAELKGRGL